MHEAEQAAARQVLTLVGETDSFLVGDVEESEIPELERQGLIVQEQPAVASGSPESGFKVLTKAWGNRGPLLNAQIMCWTFRK